MYYAQEVLTRFPAIASAVANRFHELVVDEYQDTNDTQLECVRLLHSTGQLKSLVLVGDLDQAIFGFAGADPDAAHQFGTDAGLTKLPLSHTFRCSQRICDVAARFTGNPTTAFKATGRSHDCAHHPQILRYDKDDLDPLLTEFHQHLESLDIGIQHARILSYGNSLVDSFTGATPDKASPTVKLLGSIAARTAARITLAADDIRRLERLLGSIAWGATSLDALPEQQRRLLRQATLKLLGNMPSLDMSMKDWATQTRAAIDQSVRDLATAPTRKTSDVVKCPAGAGGNMASALFAMTDANRIAAKTIHTAKGETHEAILLVATMADARKWIARGATVVDNEPMRLAYVGITRARQLVSLALPHDLPTSVVDKYAELGFAVPS